MSTSNAFLLEAKNLTREFDEGQVKALRGVDFSIKEGEFVAITGPSGCGKTILLKVLFTSTIACLLIRGSSRRGSIVAVRARAAAQRANSPCSTR